MVNTPPPDPRLVPYIPPPRPFPVGTRVKLGGPLYRLDVVKSLADPSNIRLITEKCLVDVASLGWTVPDVSDVIMLLEAHHFHDSEWCETGKGMQVDCDSYRISLDLVTRLESPQGARMYLKFGFRPNFSLLLIVSCHD